jgi:hypothetical protein
MTPMRSHTLALALAAIFALPLALDAQRDPSGSRSNDRQFTMSLVGDAILTRRLSPFTEPSFLRAMDVVRSGDISFANLETLFHDYEVSASAQSGQLGTWLRGDPSLAKELLWSGIDLVSLANDHAWDFGDEGMALTRKYLREVDIIDAGSGEDLRQAREARFFETNDGRVALVATTATFTAEAPAAPPRSGVRGRPGINPLAITGAGPRAIPAADLERLRATLQQIGQPAPAGDSLNVFGTRLVSGEGYAQRGTPNATDVAQMRDVVRNAALLSDHVIVSMHSHTQSAALRTFAHAMIDAGAATVVGHGPHKLQGIEIYNGKPIFYSLGDFIFEPDGVERLPADAFTRYGLPTTATVAEFEALRVPAETSDYQSVIALPTFEGKRLVSVELHPLDLNANGGPTTRGRPMLADKALGRKIIEGLAAQSAPLGTVIEWDEARGIGVVRIPRTE